MEESKGQQDDFYQISSNQIVQFLKQNEKLLFIQFNDLFKESYMDVLPGNWYQSLIEEVKNPKTMFDVVNSLWPQDLQQYVAKALQLAEFVPRSKPQIKYVDTKSKKDHEVMILADFIENEIMQGQQLQTQIVDIGCGKGYLSIEIAERAMLNQANLQIAMIDGSQGNIDACKAEVEKKNLKSIITQIDTKWITPENYQEIIPHDKQKTIITGIHQCGDLSSSSMREFVRNPHVTDLAVVGCCYNCLSELIDKENLSNNCAAYQHYMKTLGIDKTGRSLDDSLIDLNDSGKQIHGFPLSKFIQSLTKTSNMFLGRTVRNAATVSLKSEKLLLNFPETMTKLYYRAVIQELIFDKLIPGQYSQKKIKRVLGMTFSSYCQKSLGNSLGELNLEQLQKDYDENYLKRFNDFKILYCLKALMSPLVESLIALDRVIFIQENCQENLNLCKIVEIFEKSKSTRNFLIHASKKNKQIN